MTMIRADCAEIGKCAMRLLRSRTEAERLLSAVDGEIRALGAAWDGDDRLHFARHWEGALSQEAVIRQTQRLQEACASHLLSAARTYRDAQIDILNAALQLPR